jgi:hypothetical protein
MVSRTLWFVAEKMYEGKVIECKGALLTVRDGTMGIQWVAVFPTLALLARAKDVAEFLRIRQAIAKRHDIPSEIWLLGLASSIRQVRSCTQTCT